MRAPAAPHFAPAETAANVEGSHQNHEGSGNCLAVGGVATVGATRKRRPQSSTTANHVPVVGKLAGIHGRQGAPALAARLPTNELLLQRIGASPTGPRTRPKHLHGAGERCYRRVAKGGSRQTSNQDGLRSSLPPSRWFHLGCVGEGRANRNQEMFGTMLCH